MKNLWLSKIGGNGNMKNFIAGEYRQQREYRSFTPSFVNCPFIWENPQINLLIEHAAKLLGELNAYAELRPDVNFSIPMNIAKEATYLQSD